MNNIKLLIISVLCFGMYACGNENNELEDKKAQIQDYKKQINELETKVKALETEVAQADPGFATSDRNATLITTLPVKNQQFKHYIEVSGNVASDKNVTINAEAPAKVMNVNVEKGDKVKRGQVLITQDTETIKRNLEELQTSLELAKTRFERQANLWEQNIGTEMQYLETKNNKESLERRLASAQSQLDNYILRAPFSGTIDEVFVKEGEVAMAGIPLLRLVSLEDMYIVADVSEAYLGEFDRGDSVTVNFPSLNKTIQSTISSVGQVINQNNRTFEIQVKLPNDASLLRPNLLSVLEIKDYEQDSAIVVPTNLIQSDNRGDYVFVVEKTENGMTAMKKRVERGMTYNNETMIKSGLAQNDMLINEGAREVGEGGVVRISEQNNIGNAVSSNK